MERLRPLRARWQMPVGWMPLVTRSADQLWVRRMPLVTWVVASMLLLGPLWTQPWNKAVHLLLRMRLLAQQKTQVPKVLTMLKK